MTDKKSHRIMHIMNRNIANSYKYTQEEVKNAFLKKDYDEATQRERIVYGRFFKECDLEDLDTLIDFFGLKKENIISIYSKIPERVFSGVRDTWDKGFGLV